MIEIAGKAGALSFIIFLILVCIYFHKVKTIKRYNREKIRYNFSTVADSETHIIKNMAFFFAAVSLFLSNIAIIAEGL